MSGPVAGNPLAIGGSPHQSPGMVIRSHHIRSYLSLAAANAPDVGEAQSHAQHRRKDVNDMSTGQHHDSGRYEIRLKGHLDTAWPPGSTEWTSSTRAIEKPSFPDR
jgi:hypothetical protein